VEKAYKFLERGTRGRFSGLRWPLPSANSPGDWVEARGPLAPCVHGIHACRLIDLPHWLDTELWEIELDGELQVGKTMVVAQRGRLLRRVRAWDEDLKKQFGAFCLQRAREFEALLSHQPQRALAGRYAGDVQAVLGLGQLATAAYIAAVGAKLLSEADEVTAYDRERSVQASWLADRLS
jgi:nitrogen fixation/metabolism regulation signal transduction histidine kinase